MHCFVTGAPQCATFNPLFTTYCRIPFYSIHVNRRAIGRVTTLVPPGEYMSEKGR
eukprot:m.348962 g.348962  ORF g.348962 m.348962 type:complete len:55 (-) comp20683_c0_seq14:1790-1954(-)